MVKILKFLHVLGIVLFLGSIITFIIVSSRIEGASLENTLFGRQIISAGSAALTLPGLWLIGISGILMAAIKYGFKVNFLRLKGVIFILILINAYLFVLPNVSHATELAASSLKSGLLDEGYREAYLQESITGGINVLLSFAATFIAIWNVRSGEIKA
jgi:hypothetical protein